MSTDTPRTDAAIVQRDFGQGLVDWVPVKFVRGLEKKLAAKDAEIKRLKADGAAEAFVTMAARADTPKTVTALGKVWLLLETALTQKDQDAVYALVVRADQLERELAASEAARRDEESWWKERHDYKARAETAEAERDRYRDGMKTHVDNFNLLLAERNELRAQLAAAWEDGERLDWLERHAATFAQSHVSRYPFAAPNKDKRWMAKIEYWEFYADTWRGAVDGLRAAIDAAREGRT